MTKWLVYMLSCSDKSIYTGITTDINRRVKQHNEKKGAKSLFGKLPVKVVFIEKQINLQTAAKREREIKSWSHAKKMSLVANSVRW